MQDLGEFEFKIAPLGRRTRYRISDQRIEQLDPTGGTTAEADLSQIQSVRWSETCTNRMVVRNLDVRTASGSLSFGQSIGAGATREHPELASYLAAVTAVLSALATARPDLEVTRGEAPVLRWARFVMLLAVAGVIMIPMSVLLGRRDAADLWWVAASLGGCMLVCLFFAWRAAPWRPPARTPVGECAASFAAEVRSGA